MANVPSPSDMKALLGAMLSAFLRWEELEQWLYFELEGRRLAEITAPGALGQVVFAVLTKAASEGWYDRVAEAVIRTRAGNPEVARYAASRAHVDAAAVTTPPWTTPRGDGASDGAPLEANAPSNRELRATLAAVFSSSSRIRMLLNDAGVKTTRIAFEQPPEVIWDAALSEAREDGRLSAVLKIASEEYPSNRALADLARRTRG